MLPRTANIILRTVLRAIGDTQSPMQVGFIMNGINIVLNFLLIYPSREVWGSIVPGAGMGIVGAAIAGAVSYTVGGIWITVKVGQHPDISPASHSLKPDKVVLLPCLKIASPNMMQRFGTSLGYVAFASMINSLGEISTAAHTIANTVKSAFYIPGFGMQTAAATLAGNALGAQDKQRMKDLTKMLVLLEALMMIVSGGLLFVFAPDMMRLFSGSAEVIMLGALVLRMVPVSEPFYGVSIVLEGVLQGVGKTIVPFIYNILGMWGIRIVGTFICIHFLHYGLVSVWSCMIAHNMLLFVLFTVHYLRGKWNPMNAEMHI